jgi:hypothetical protein
MSGPTINKPTAAEISKNAAEDKLARDQRAARQKKLAQLVKEKNAGSGVIQTSSTVRGNGRRPVANKRRQPFTDAPEATKVHNPVAARKHAAAELKKRQDAKELAEREANLKAGLERIKQAHAAATTATQTPPTSPDQATSTSPDDDSDLDMPDVNSVSNEDDHEASESNNSVATDDTSDAQSSQNPQFNHNYDTIVEKNSSAVHKHVTIDTCPAVAMESKVLPVDEGEAPLLVDTSATVSEKFVYSNGIVENNKGVIHFQSTIAATKDDSEPILAFGPAPTEVDLEPILAFGPAPWDPIMKSKVPAVDEGDDCPPPTDTSTRLEQNNDDDTQDAAEQSESAVVDEISVSTPVAENVTVAEETTELPERNDGDVSAQVVTDNDSDLGSVGSSSIKSYDVVGVTDVAATINQVFECFPKALEYELLSDGAPAEDKPETGFSQAIIELIEPTIQQAEREAPLTIITDKPGFVAAMLSLPNGSDATKESRELEIKLIDLHVLALQLPVLVFNTQKKTKKAKQSVETVAVEPVAEDGPFITDESIVVGEPATVDEIATVIEAGIDQPTVEATFLPDDGSAEIDQTNEPAAPCDNTSGLDLSIVDPEPDQEIDVVIETAVATDNANSLGDADIDDGLITADEHATAEELCLTITEIAPANEPTEVEMPTVVVTPADDIQTPEVALPEKSSEVANERPEVNMVETSPRVSARSRRRGSGHSSDTAVSGEVTPRGSSARSDQSSRKHIDSEAHIAKTTYLGVTSLAVFVNTVIFERDGTTTKTDICEAFATLSAADTEGITGKRPTQSYTDFESPRTQRRLKLGDTSLCGLLKHIAFDDDDVTTITSVMRAFREAAKEDDSPSDKLVAALTLEASSDSDTSRRSRRSSGSRRAIESASLWVGALSA